MPDTEVLACPSCRHTLRVPADWLGQEVQCPECRATFTAPTRGPDGRLTAPVLLSAAPVAAAPRRSNAFLMLPGFGLILVGVASLAVNGFMQAKFLAGPDGGKNWFKDQIPALREAGVVPPDADDDAAAADLARQLRWVWPAALAAAALTVAGGVSLVRRRHYRLAQVGCVAAALNLPHLCCVPGAVFGFWGILMLLGDDGFGADPRQPAA